MLTVVQQRAALGERMMRSAAAMMALAMQLAEGELLSYPELHGAGSPWYDWHELVSQAYDEGLIRTR